MPRYKAFWGQDTDLGYSTTADQVIEQDKQIDTGILLPDGRRLYRIVGLERLGFDLEGEGNAKSTA